MKLKRYTQRINLGPVNATIMPIYGNISYSRREEFDLPMTIERGFDEGVDNFIQRAFRELGSIEDFIRETTGYEPNIWLKIGKDNFLNRGHKYWIESKTPGRQKGYKVKVKELKQKNKNE